MSTDVIVDALPYIDHGYDEPGVREAALAMVEEETRRYRPTKNYLDHLPALNLTSFETELMKTEFKRMQEREVKLIEIILCFTGFLELELQCR